MTEQVEVVIIGGGQAGLALSHYLTRQGRTHLVLEQGRVGETWRSGRWDSFTLNTPNWMTRLPGLPYQGDNPDGFLQREDVVAYLEQYAASFHAPLRCGVRVTAVRQQPGGDGYLVEAEQGRAGRRHRPVRLPGRRRFARERAAGLLVHLELRKTPTTLPGEGHHLVAHQNWIFRQNA